MLVDRGFEDKNSRVPEESDPSMYEELGELTKYVEIMTRTIAEMEVPVTSTSDQLPQATAHLHELATLTEEGTHRVMSLTEGIQESHGHIKKLLRNMSVEPESVISNQINTILNMLEKDSTRLNDITVALSFQDIVAQRVGKLMTVLEEVQHKLLKLVVVFGLQTKKEDGNQKKEGRGYEMLRQLEASKSTSLKQDFVDEILSEFGFQ